MTAIAGNDYVQTMNLKINVILTFLLLAFLFSASCRTERLLIRSDYKPDFLYSAEVEVTKFTTDGVSEEDSLVIQKALRERLNKDFPHSGTSELVSGEVKYSLNYHYDRNLLLDIFSTITSGLMFVAIEEGAVEVVMEVTLIASQELNHIAPSYKFSIEIEVPYDSNFCYWFDDEPKLTAIKQANSIAFAKMSNHISWWLKNPAQDDLNKTEEQLKEYSAQEPLFYRTTKANTELITRRTVDGDLVGFEKIVAEEKESTVSKILSLIGGVEVGYITGVTSASSQVIGQNGNSYEVASGEGKISGYSVRINSPPKRSGFFFKPTGGFLSLNINIEDVEGLYQGADIPAVATDPLTGESINLDDSWNYNLSLRSVYLGQRVGGTLVFGTPDLQFFALIEGGANVFEWRHGKVKWNKYSREANDVSFFQSFSARGVIGLVYRPFHVGVVCEGMLDHYKKFTYPEPIPFRGVEQYNKILEVYERPDMNAESVQLNVANLLCGVMLFY